MRSGTRKDADEYHTVDYKVYGPTSTPGRDHVILEGEKERQGDFAFTANERGEYRFCFDNTISTFADKLVDFDITVSRARVGREAETES